MTPFGSSSAVTTGDDAYGPIDTLHSFMGRWIEQRSLPLNLREAIRYSLLAPGKRTRPLLLMHSCEALGGALDDAVAPAAAIEMIHAFSLVHDDRPALDNDDLRRGRPTLHRQSCEAMAILAGDAMMGLAFELVAESVEPPVRAQRVLQELLRGCNDMIVGQVYDTLPCPDDTLPARVRLDRIHSNKTGALIRAACRIGAICADADQQGLASMSRYGEAIGLMFQIVDDLLDVTQTTEHLGKTAGKDADQDKLTYPAVLGVEASRAEVARLRRDALDALSHLGPDAEPLSRLCEYLAVRTK